MQVKGPVNSLSGVESCACGELLSTPSEGGSDSGALCQYEGGTEGGRERGDVHLTHSVCTGFVPVAQSIIRCCIKNSLSSPPLYVFWAFAGWGGEVEKSLLFPIHEPWQGRRK